MPEPEAERPIVKVEVNRNQKPLGIAFDLCETMEASGSFTTEQVSEVRRAALAGDETELNTVIDRYAV